MTGTSQLPRNYFFVLAPPRSGSTWFQQTLDAHPDVSCLFEPNRTLLNRIFLWLRPPFELHRSTSLDHIRKLLLPYVPLSPHYCLNRLNKHLCHTSTYLAGAKIVIPSLFESVSFSKFFMRYHKARFIVLDRECIVDAMCSWTIAKRSKVWHSRTPIQSPPSPFPIDLTNASEYIISHLLHRRLTLASLQQMNSQFICLTYEHMMADKQKALASVADFLGTTEFRHYSRLQKLWVWPYNEIITNYNELLELERNIKQQQMQL